MGNGRNSTQRGWRKAKSESDTPNRPTRLSWKDYVTLSFSAVALGLSGLSTYFSFFRDETSAVAMVVGQYADAPETIAVAVMNTGNRQFGIVGGEIYSASPDYRESWPPTINAARTFAVSPELPLSVEPGKVVILTFTVGNVEELLTSATAKDDPKWTPRYSYVTVGVRLSAISATGTDLVATLDTVTLQLNDEGHIVGKGLERAPALFSTDPDDESVNWFPLNRPDE